MQFIVRRILNQDIKNEVEKIGFSPSYLDFGILKHKFLNIKIYNLKPEASTIIKQTALSLGCDAAVHKGVLDHSIEKSDLILSGTISELEAIAEKLKKQQFSLPEISNKILAQIEIYKTDELLDHKKAFRPKIMGILNVTDDSFSDGGLFLNPKNALEHALKMVKDGADIIDIGAESTRPNADIIPSDIEIKRLTPIVRELKRELAYSKIKISIDTRNADTARAMADLGADIVNDVSGLFFDKNMLKTIKETEANIVIMHSRGTPNNMENLCQYKNTTDEVYSELLYRVQNAVNGGIQPHKIIIDPGFGFAKNDVQNFEILKRIEEFKSLGFPILVGLSRKRFIKNILPEKEALKNSQNALSNDILDDLTANLSFYFTLKKIDIIRVHNVEKTRRAIDLAGHLI